MGTFLEVRHCSGHIPKKGIEVELFHFQYLRSAQTHGTYPSVMSDEFLGPSANGAHDPGMSSIGATIEIRKHHKALLKRHLSWVDRWEQSFSFPHLVSFELASQSVESLDIVVYGCVFLLAHHFEFSSIFSGPPEVGKPVIHAASNDGPDPLQLSRAHRLGAQIIGGQLPGTCGLHRIGCKPYFPGRGMFGNDMLSRYLQDLKSPAGYPPLRSFSSTPLLSTQVSDNVPEGFRQTERIIELILHVRPVYLFL